MVGWSHGSSGTMLAYSWVQTPAPPKKHHTLHTFNSTATYIFSFKSHILNTSKKTRLRKLKITQFSSGKPRETLRLSLQILQFRPFSMTRCLKRGQNAKKKVKVWKQKEKARELGLYPKGKVKRMNKTASSYLILSFCIILVFFTTSWVLILQRLLMKTNYSASQEKGLYKSTCIVIVTTSKQ
jgi:hypothetical protein